MKSTVYDFSNPNNEETPYYTQELKPGRYLFECWGASGGGPDDWGGKGGYVLGYIKVNKTTTFYIVVGGAGTKNIGGFNGGGNGGVGIVTEGNKDPNGFGGGGATDIRLSTDQKQIIIIAGGGGGACGYSSNAGGHAGGIVGGYSRKENNDTSCVDKLSSGGSQETNQKWEGADGRSLTSVYGELKNCPYCGCEGNGGGGGGYYGGISTDSTEIGSDSGGGGGSSCVSGHQQCDVINNIYFSYIKIISGNETMHQPNGEYYEGHSGDGYARITLIVPTQARLFNNFFKLSSFVVIIFLKKK